MLEIRDGADRLLEASWATRSRRMSRRELVSELVAAAVFTVAAGGLLLAAGPPAAVSPGLVVLLVVLYALVSRVEFPVGPGYAVPTQLVLVPMLMLVPPALVPPLAAGGLVLGAVGDRLARRGPTERVLFSVPDAAHALGPAAVLVAAGAPRLGLAPGDVGLLALALLAGAVVDAASATGREALALGVAPRLQLRVLALVGLADGCLAPVALVVGDAAGAHPAALLAVVPLGALLLLLSRDRQNHIEQAVSRLEQASSDPLTRLGNRRRLEADLAARLARPAREGWLLMLFDLDGFKAYNDTFGHQAGDALLARLGGRLADAVAPDGDAYRLGGDEFCVLVEVRTAHLDAVVAAAAAALVETGEELSVGACYGAVLLPHEAASPDDALRLADERMYARKRRRSSPVREQASDVLVRTLQAKRDDLHDHSGTVARLAAAVARRLGLGAEQVDEVMRAAELHDLGKVGIPDGILDKPGPLDAEEWEFMRRHTVLGERILSAAPALRPVARIVRATHERWDGSGYPDGLRGEEIPLGARIVAVCDAFEAMTSDRPYRRARDPEPARRELRRAAGAQFEPAVVEAFLAELNAAPELEAVPAVGDVAAREISARVRALLSA